MIDTRLSRTALLTAVFLAAVAAPVPLAGLAQERAPLDRCPGCGAGVLAPVLLPGTPEARAALFEPLMSINHETLKPTVRTHADGPLPVTCTELALIVGAASAVAGLLLALLIDSWFPTERGSASKYVFAGGMFVGGAGYAAIRCRIESQ